MAPEHRLNNLAKVAEQTMEKLLQELKEKIIDILNQPDLVPADIQDEEPLVGGVLGVDSIDVLEMVIMIEKDYRVTINNKELGAKVFVSLKTLAEFIHANSPVFSN